MPDRETYITNSDSRTVRPASNWQGPQYRVTVRQTPFTGTLADCQRFIATNVARHLAPGQTLAISLERIQ